MKIIYLHQYFNTPEMSGGTRSYEMARRLVAAGHEVHMITSWRRDNPQQEGWFTTQEQGIHVHWLPVPYSNTMSYMQRIRAFFDFAIAAKRKAAESNGDVIFATSTPLTIAIPAVFAAKKHKIPMVFEVRDLWPELPAAMGAIKNPVLLTLVKKFEKWAYKNSTAIVALSDGMKDGVVKAGYPADKVTVIPNSSDNSEFKYSADAARSFRAARPWLGDRPLLVYAGTFGRINGVGYLVELAAALAEIAPEVRILIVGGGQEQAKILKLAKEQNVFEKNFFMESKLPKKEIPALLSAANMASSLFIDLPEMQANSANKFFDALASGTAVMINYGGWQHELVNTYGCGLTTWHLPVNEAAVIVAEKIQDPEWLANAGNAARRLAEEQFDRDLLAARLEKTIKAVVHNEPEDEARITDKNWA